MDGLSMIKNLFSILNILLITYLLIDRKSNQSYRKKNWYSYVLCIGSNFSGAGNGEWGIHTYRL